jgi:hypothetical protein
MWFEYNKRYDVFVKRDPCKFENISYQKLVPTKSCVDFDYKQILLYLLDLHHKNVEDISHVVYTTEEEGKRSCSFKDLLEYIEVQCEIDDIIKKDIVIKGKGDWWICYDCDRLWDFYLIAKS